MTHVTTYSTIPQNIPAPDREAPRPTMTMAEMAAQEVERTKVLFGCQSANWKARRNTTLREQVMRIIDLLRDRPMTTLELAERIGVKRATVSSYLADARTAGYDLEGEKGKEIYLVAEPDEMDVEAVKATPSERGKAERAVSLLSQQPMTTDQIAAHYGVARSTASDYISKARKQGYTIERDTKTGLYYLREGARD